MRRALLIFSLLGFGAFGSIFALSFLNPLLIEKAAREAIRIEVERRVGAKLDDLSNSKVISLAQRALGKTDVELEDAKRALAAKWATSRNSSASAPAPRRFPRPPNAAQELGKHARF